MESWQSDLASECGVCEGEGIRYQQVQAGGCEILRVRVESEEGALRIGKPQGRYITLECGNVCKLDQGDMERVCRTLAVEIREMARRMSGKRLGAAFCVLVVGLGNAEMTADALGPQTVRALTVTRHLPNEARGLLCESTCGIAALLPGVPGQTGIETVELVQGAVHSIRPDLVIAVDALAARSPDRLAATVQLCDTGIRPGSGVGRARGALTSEVLGVPVMAIGVPTVIRCGSLIADAREGVETPPSLWERVRDLCVCPGEIDLVVGRAALLLARSIEKAFCI